MSEFNIEQFTKFGKALEELKSNGNEKEKLDFIINYLIDSNQFLQKYGALINSLTENDLLVAEYQKITTDTLQKLHNANESQHEVISVNEQRIDIQEKHIEIFDKHIDLISERLDLIDQRLDIIDP